MNRRRVVVLRAGAAACLASAALLWLPTSSVSAQAGSGEVEVGWWYRLSGQSAPASSASDGGAAAAQTAPPPTLPPSPVPVPTVPAGESDPPAVPAPLPPPASVPDGGMYVANDSFGPVAIGAVRFHREQVGSATLTLRFGQGAGGAALPIVACPVLEGFEPVSNGAWRDRPAHDCARITVSGSIGSNGAMTFQLNEAFQSADQTTFAAIILPLPGDGTPFSAPIQPVTSGSLEVLGAAPPRPPAPTPTTFAFGEGSGAGAGAFDGGGSRVPGGFTPGGGGVVPAPGATETAAPGASTGDGDTSVSSAPLASLFDEKGWARPVATLLLAALAIALGVASTGRLPMLAGVFGGGAGGEKGIGRFARKRTGPPPALV